MGRENSSSRLAYCATASKEKSSMERRDEEELEILDCSTESTFLSEESEPKISSGLDFIEDTIDNIMAHEKILSFFFPCKNVQSSSPSKRSIQPPPLITTFCGNDMNGPKSPLLKMSNKIETGRPRFSLQTIEGRDSYDVDNARERYGENMRETSDINICGGAPAFCGIYSKEDSAL